MKLIWRVSPEPTGRYRSFDKRGWPSAYYNNKDETPCAFIVCDDDYTTKRAKEGTHGPLTLRIADHSQKPWKWRVVKKRFATLDEAKSAVEDFLKRYPHLIPSE